MNRYNKRGAGTLGDFLIAGIIVSILAVGATTIMLSMGRSYGFDTPNELTGGDGNQSFSQLAALESNSSFFTKTFAGGDYASSIGFFPAAVVNTMLIVPNFFSVTVIMLSTGTKVLGLPGLAFSGILLMIGLTVTLMIVSIFARWNVD